MACSKCRRSKCTCKKVAIFDDRPEVVKVQTIPVPGQSGDTPYVGINDNWWIGGEDTGIPATGEAGDTYIPEFSDNVFDL